MLPVFNVLLKIFTIISPYLRIASDLYTPILIKMHSHFLNTSCSYYYKIQDMTVILQLYLYFTASVVPSPCDDSNLEGYTLLQAGKKLDISALVKAKKYKGRGNKAAAVEACKKLQEKGFGELCELGSSRGTSMVSGKVATVTPFSHEICYRNRYIYSSNVPPNVLDTFYCFRPDY